MDPGFDQEFQMAFDSSHQEESHSKVVHDETAGNSPRSLEHRVEYYPVYEPDQEY